jgi:hypothetical protein
MRIKKRIFCGSLIWRLTTIPIGIISKKIRLKEIFYNKERTEKMKNYIKERMSNANFKKKHLTVVITSCGRVDYLKKTINSLKKNIIYDKDKIHWMIIEDNLSNIETKNYIKELRGFDKKIINKKNLGQYISINKIYSEVRTEYIFHSEDDWLYIKKIPIEKMIQTLEKNKLRQLLLNRGGNCYDNNKIKNKRDYGEIDYIFSMNPHLTKISIFLSNYPIPLFYGESRYSYKLYKKGFKKGGIFGYNKDIYLKHIGEESIYRYKNKK